MSAGAPKLPPPPVIPRLRSKPAVLVTAVVLDGIRYSITPWRSR